MEANTNLQTNRMFGPGAAAIDPKAVAGFYAVDNLRAIEPADLADEKMFTKIAMFVRGLDDDGAGFRAKETLEILLNLLNENQALPETDPDLFRSYFYLIVMLKTIFLGLLEPREVAEFLRTQMLMAITIPILPFREFDFLFSLKDRISSYIKFDSWYLPEGEKKEILRTFVEAVEKNEEYLGEEELEIEGKSPLEPIVENWLLDYNQTIHPTLGKRSSFDRAKYLNTSPLVKQLGMNQKLILQHLLEFYDWIKFETGTLVFNEGLKRLNQIVIEEDQKLKTEPQQKVPAIVPASGFNLPLGAKTAPTLNQHPVVQAPFLPNFKPENFSPLSATPTKAAQVFEPEKSVDLLQVKGVLTNEIDKRLEDLKKRKQNN